MYIPNVSIIYIFLINKHIHGRYVYPVDYSYTSHSYSMSTINIFVRWYYICILIILSYLLYWLHSDLSEVDSREWRGPLADPWPFQGVLAPPEHRTLRETKLAYKRLKTNKKIFKSIIFYVFLHNMCLKCQKSGRKLVMFCRKTEKHWGEGG